MILRQGNHPSYLHFCITPNYSISTIVLEHSIKKISIHNIQTEETTLKGVSEVYISPTFWQQQVNDNNIFQDDDVSWTNG